MIYFSSPRYLYFIVILFVSIPFAMLGQNIDPVQLDDEISQLNDVHDYQTSILKLDEIINNPSSTHFDKTYAYIQKSYTYKRVYNYVVALANLDLAGEEASKSTTDREKLETLVLVEKMFIHFDQQQNGEVERILEQLNDERVSTLGRETRAFYYSVLGVLATRKKDFLEAEKRYDMAIELLEQKNPKHLPNIYRAKVILYGEMDNENHTMDNHEKAMKAYEAGVYYAEKYEVDIYKIIMAETMTKYYADKGDYENAFRWQIEVNEKRKRYGAHEISATLTTLESQLREQRKQIELKNQRRIQYYLGALTGILALLLFVMWKLLSVNKQKKALIESENKYIRAEVERLTKTIDMKVAPTINLENYGLTERQLEVIQQVKKGKTNKEIGEELFISENTVKYHLKAIYEILGVEGRSALRNHYS